MNTAYIIDAARTPRGIGKPGKGALNGLHPQHLLSTVLKALSDRNSLNTDEIDDVIMGCSMQQGLQRLQGRAVHLPLLRIPCGHH